MSINETTINERSHKTIVDDHGRPKDELTFRIVRLFFSPPFPPPKPSFTVKEVAALLASDFLKTETIIHQLAHEEILSENPEKPGVFFYNYQCPYVEHQAKLEKHLLEEEMKFKFTDSYVEFFPSNLA